MTIYRGYDIEKCKVEGWEIDGYQITKNGQVIHTASSEDAAMDWIDKEKRNERK